MHFACDDEESWAEHNIPFEYESVESAQRYILDGMIKAHKAYCRQVSLQFRMRDILAPYVQRRIEPSKADAEKLETISQQINELSGGPIHTFRFCGIDFALTEFVSNESARNQLNAAMYDLKQLDYVDAVIWDDLDLQIMSLEQWFETFCEDVHQP